MKLVRLTTATRKCVASEALTRCPADKVESSKRLYASLISLCRVHYVKESMLAVCSLRSQLPLAFHESKALAGGVCPLDVASVDHCFDLARDLDACLKVPLRAGRGRVVTIID